MPRRNPSDTFKFEELSDRAKERAIESFRQNCDFDWFEDDVNQFIEDFLVPDLAKYGIHIKEEGRRGYAVQYSLSYSQGDGLSFEATFEPWEYIDHFNLKDSYPNLVKLYDEFDDKVEVFGELTRSSHRYAHENTISLDSSVRIHVEEEEVEEAGMSEWPNALRILAAAEREGEAVLGDIEEFCKEKMQEAFSTIRNMYEDVTSDESVADLIEANEYEFYADGTWTGARGHYSEYEEG